MKTPYEIHSTNLRAIEQMLTQIALSSKQQIRLKNHKQNSFFNRLYALMLGVWSEVRLHKILTESGGFSPKKQSIILEERTIYDRWEKCITYAFQNKYQCRIKNLPKTSKFRYEFIIKLMEDEIKPIITMRNRLAHGQFIYPLKADSYDIDTESMRVLNTENILKLQIKKNLLNNISELINDLVLSKPTFERDFDRHCKLIEDRKNEIKNRSYQKYVEKITRSKKRA